MNADKIKQIVAGVLTLAVVVLPGSSGLINAAGGQAEILAGGDRGLHRGLTASSTTCTPKPRAKWPPRKEQRPPSCWGRYCLSLGRSFPA